MLVDRYNRMGIDGHVVRMPIRTMYDVTKSLPVRITYIIPGDHGTDNKDLIDFVCGHLADVGMSTPNMFAMLVHIRARFKVAEGYLKLAAHYPVKERSRVGQYRVALECHLTRTRPRSYTSVAIDYPGRITLRVTLEVSPETELHVEEVLSLVNEVYHPSQHKKVGPLIEAVGTRLNSYSRIKDYLLLGNQVRGGLGYVSQRWMGVTGGMRPMPGLERVVLDI